MIFLNLDRLENASKLTKICEKYSKYMEVDVTYGRYVIDGCSILGVTSLLGNIVKLKPRTDDSLLVEYFIKDVKEIGAWVENVN